MAHSLWTVHALAGSILQQVDGITGINLDDRSIRISVAYNRDARLVAKSIGAGLPRREVVGPNQLEVFHVDLDGVDVGVYGTFLGAVAS